MGWVFRGFVFLFILNASQSKADCRNLFIEQFLVAEKITFTKPKAIDLKQAYAHFIEFGRSINAVLGDLSVSDVNLFFSTESSYKTSRYGQLKQRLEIGLAEFQSTPEKVETVYAHEFAHISFAEHMVLSVGGQRNTFNHWLNNLNEERANLAANPNYLKLINKINELSQAGEGKNKKKIERVAEMLNQQFGVDKWNEKYSEFMFKMKFLLPYNELYADIVAVLTKNNPSAVAEALDLNDPQGDLYSLHRQNNPEAGRPRDFAATISFKDWQHESPEGDINTLFDPVRSVLWKLFLNKANAEQKENFLKAYLSATEEHAELRLQRMDNLETIENAEKLNREFLQLIIKHAKRNGLNIQK